MSTTRLKAAFWQVVSDCLLAFHGRTDEEQAMMEAMRLRVRIENAPGGIDSDMIYHAEPFDLACDLAQRKLDLSEHRERYDRLYDARFAGIEEDAPSQRAAIQPRTATG